ncbi:MAG: DUF2791 family P-loop domain-containing protein [Candidatus Eremiobacteraeota bacterium]|nr:DUF2791 family P-loop domain-containing protein [Candidatus Eremiobacteraeota bacterium]MCW5872895.1 DUF2791 family P-loop domain-containing protein [Candidatus Eremiobacteraeota bacterium]
MAAVSNQEIPVDAWLKILLDDYLNQFVAAGGSAVKVVSGSEEVLARVRQRLAEQAQQSGFWHAHLDPAELEESGKKKDLHRMDRFFFECTRAVDYKAWSAIQVRRHLESRGVRIGPDRALNDLEAIAGDNSRDPADLMHQYQAELATPQLRDHGMAREFRTAVTALGRAQLMPDANSPNIEEVLLAWFAGQTRPGGATALKKIQIYERISQSNARAMLASFCHWLPQLGHPGLVVTLDLRPYEGKKPTAAQLREQKMLSLNEAIEAGLGKDELNAVLHAPDPTGLYYTDLAYQNMLALLRRFIDEIDSFERFLLVVLTSRSFYDLGSPRNYHNYDALQTRIGLEVRGANQANPSAALVHLAGAL